MWRPPWGRACRWPAACTPGWGMIPALAALVRPGRWIWDLRREPPDLAVASGRAAGLPGRRLLAVGTDMSVGKMSACLELQAAARRRGLDARFVGTGQAGILISGSGVALDAVRVDYAAGAVEGAVLAAAAAAGPDTLVLVEGQGSLCHPGSSATLPLHPRQPAHRSAAGAPSRPAHDPAAGDHPPAAPGSGDRRGRGPGGPGPAGGISPAATSGGGHRSQHRPPGRDGGGGGPGGHGGGDGAALRRSGAAGRRDPAGRTGHEKRPDA